MILQDLHVHSTWSDGKNTPEEIAREACARGVRRLGFSDHVYAPYDTDCCMKQGAAAAYRREIAGLKAEVEYVSGLLEQHIAANARTVQDQTEYKRQYDEHEHRYIDLSNRLAALEARSAALRAKQEGIERYIDILRKNDRISTFDPALCLNTVERITVFPEGRLRFEFLGGQVVEG